MTTREDLVRLIEPLGHWKYNGDIDDVADAILASDVIKQIKAEAWDEGGVAACENLARDFWDDDDPIPNPYRKADVQQIIEKELVMPDTPYTPSVEEAR